MLHIHMYVCICTLCFAVFHKKPARTSDFRRRCLIAHHHICLGTSGSVNKTTTTEHPQIDHLQGTIRGVGLGVFPRKKTWKTYTKVKKSNNLRKTKN